MNSLVIDRFDEMEFLLKRMPIKAYYRSNKEQRIVVKVARNFMIEITRVIGRKQVRTEFIQFKVLYYKKNNMVFSHKDITGKVSPCLILRYNIVSVAKGLQKILDNPLLYIEKQIPKIPVYTYDIFGERQKEFMFDFEVAARRKEGYVIEDRA